MISKGETDGKKWQNYSGKYIEPKDHPLFKDLEGWYVHCALVGTHVQFDAWNPSDSPGMWEEDPGEGWIKISEHYPLIKTA